MSKVSGNNKSLNLAALKNLQKTNDFSWSGKFKKSSKSSSTKSVNTSTASAASASVSSTASTTASTTLQSNTGNLTATSSAASEILALAAAAASVLDSNSDSVSLSSDLADPIDPVDVEPTATAAASLSGSASTVKVERLERKKESISDKLSQQRKKYETKSADKAKESMVDSYKSLNSASTQVDSAKAKVASLNDLLEQLKSGNLDQESIDTAKEQLAKIVEDLGKIRDDASYKGSSVFSKDFSVALSNGGDSFKTIDIAGSGLVPKPDSVTNLAPTQTINSIDKGNFDSFGSKIFANDKYLVVAAKDAGTLNSSTVALDQKYNDGAVDVFDIETGAALGRYSLGQAGGAFSKTINDAKYFTGLTGAPGNTDYKNDFRNLNFGADFDVEGDYMVVGAPSLDGKDKNGTAFLYDIKNERLVKELKMPAGKTDTNFGKAVEIADDKVFVSSYSDKSKLYTFDLNGNSTGVINSPSGVDFLGADITSSGDNIIISSSKEKSGGKNGAGEVYVYDSATNALKFTLKSPNAGDENGFGSKVEAYGNLLAVSEPMRLDDKGAEKGGKVHLFDANTGELVRTLTPTSNLTGGEKFGSAIAMSDKFIAVAAEGDDTQGRNAGAVYVFDKETGVELAKISKSGSDDFGSSIAIKDNALYVGASTDSAGGFQKAGAVHKYDISSLVTTASKYKQDLAGQNATGIVADGLDMGYLEGIDLDSLVGEDSEDAKATLTTIQKNVTQIASFISGVKEGLTKANSHLESRIGSSINNKYIADANTDAGTTVVFG